MDNDEVETTWNSWERRVIIMRNKVIKSELHERDFLRTPTGHIIPPYWAKERLRNGAATLELVASRTTIPVPKCRLYTCDEVICLEMTRISNGILLMDVEASFRAAAIKAVEKQMETSILPQLRSIRRTYIGSVDEAIPVFPPQRIYSRDRRNWPRITSNTEDFVLCHNDLGPQNVFVDAETFDIFGIIDWEFAGFFPPSFELPLWRERNWEDGKKMFEDALPRELGFFGLKEDELDCSLVSP